MQHQQAAIRSALQGGNLYYHVLEENIPITDALYQRGHNAQVRIRPRGEKAQVCS